MAAGETQDDPIAKEARRAREDRDGSLLPSNDGLGPGAGETPAADVTSSSDDVEATSTPSLGAPPKREQRPDFRSSQLDGAPPERDDR